MARLKHSQTLDFICSLPLLEGLTFVALGTPNHDGLDIGGLPTETPPLAIPIHNFSDHLSDVCSGTVGIVLVGDTDRDSLKVSMVWRDGFKCRGHPLDPELRVPELSIFKTCRGREVDWKERQYIFNPR